MNGQPHTAPTKPGLLRYIGRDNIMTDGTPNTLLQNLDLIHTTPMGVERIRRNLSLKEDDVLAWCRDRIADSEAVIQRRGKNWYVSTADCVITVNVHSYTIITAHKI